MNTAFVRAIGALCWILLLVVVLVLAARADTVTVNATCAGTAPCRSWEFDLPALPSTGTAALYVTGYDFDSPAEGTLTLGGHIIPLFGPEASAANDRQTRTIGYAVDASWLVLGRNPVAIAWTTDAANDPLKHEVTALALQFGTLPAWLGPVTLLRHGTPNRLLYGFCRTDMSARTAFAVEYSGGVAARLRAMVLQFAAGQDVGFDFSAVPRLPLAEGDAAALWAQPLPAGCR